MREILALFVGAALSLDAALAFPDGAPWGAANPAAEQHCASCHFSAEPIHDSSALHIDGLPSKPVPGASYELRIVFVDPQMVSAGFQLIAYAADDDAGIITSTEEDVESIGSALRSTAPATNDKGVSWVVEWRAPVKLVSPIFFYVAASAANHDGSPLGDTIHYRLYELLTED